MVSRTQKIFDQLDARTRGGFRQMQDLKLLDLDNRKGKAPGGYQSTLAEARVPFIFMNAVGVQRDVETILHEAGHAFHALATRDEDLYAYRGAPIEFCEVASMSMELLGNEFLEEFYSAADANRARTTSSRRHHRIFSVDGDGGRVSALDLHASGPHARRARGGVAGIDGPLRRRRGLDRLRGSARASRGTGSFTFSSIRFTTSNTASRSSARCRSGRIPKRDKAKALNDYKKSLALGGSRPLPELFSAAGCKFEFSATTIRAADKTVAGGIGKTLRRPWKRLQPI